MSEMQNLTAYGLDNVRNAKFSRAWAKNVRNAKFSRVWAK